MYSSERLPVREGPRRSEGQWATINRVEPRSHGSGGVGSEPSDSSDSG
jgi:hypothetical protein